MQFTTVSSLLAVLLAVATVAALPVRREVFDPPFTFPTAGYVFAAGQTITVTWDTSSIPKGTQNRGRIVLGRLTTDSENLDLDHPLATDFLLTDGAHDITFPDPLPTGPGSNYILDLFGDSGNISDQFTLESSDDSH